MPVHLVPLAIVVAKVSASAVVSLSPAAIAMEGDGEEGGEPRRKLRDFLKPSFYMREFARLENEKVETTPPPMRSIAISHQDQSSFSLDSGMSSDHSAQSLRFRTIHREAEVEML